MSRRRQAVKRSVTPDAKFNSVLVGRLVNTIMRGGNKNVAQRIVYGALDTLAEKNPGVNSLEILQRSIENAKPLVEVRSKRIGGANYQVPVEVNRRRQQTLAIRWILEAVRSRKGKATSEKLAQELIDCYNKTGTTIQKRENTHRMAEANKAFSHFA